MILKQIEIATDRLGMYDITDTLNKIIKDNNISDGVMVVYTTHTTAAITINENADPDVKKDLLKELSIKFPKENYYEHYEGNSDAHIKSSLIGCSTSIIINNKRLLLGTWQGVYLMEFDGPRTRKVFIKIIEG